MYQASIIWNATSVLRKFSRQRPIDIYSGGGGRSEKGDISRGRVDQGTVHGAEAQILLYPKTIPKMKMKMKIKNLERYMLYNWDGS